MTKQDYFDKIDRAGTLLHLDEVIGEAMKDKDVANDFMKIIEYGADKFKPELIQEQLRELITKQRQNKL